MGGMEGLNGHLCVVLCAVGSVASVKKHPLSARWVACYKIPTGDVRPDGTKIFRRVQRSTGKTDKLQALQLAISFERAAVAASEQRWTEQSARRFLAELSALTGVSVGETEGVSQFFHRWLKGRKREIEPATYKLYAARVRDFLLFIGHRENGPLSDITRPVVAAFRDAERTAGKSAGTVNLSLTILAQAFTEAVNLGVLLTNPAKGLAIKGAKKSAQRRRAFTFEQFRKLVDACDGEWRTLVLICGYTGARQQEAASIEWSQVDLKGQRITLERGKTGDEHWLPIHPSLEAHLKTLEHGSGPIMPRLAALDGRDLSGHFREKILPQIGIAQEYRKKQGKGRKLAEYSLHSLRHSLATWLNAAGVSEMMRMRIVGHEDETISRGYTHTEFAQLAGEIAKVPKI